MKKILLMIAFIIAIGINCAMANRTHTVQKGESIESISKMFQISEEELCAANPGIETLFYIGLKLNIPDVKKTSITDNVIETPTPIQNDSHSENYSAQIGEYNASDNDMTPAVSYNSFESERNASVFEIGYSASTFKDVKTSGSYGISFMYLIKQIAPNLYAGFRASPFNLNFGLVDSDFVSDTITLGPAVGYYFTPKIFVAVPLELMCNVYFHGTDTKTAWGLDLSPCVYIGDRFGVYLGPQFSVGFNQRSKIQCGFRVGIYL